MKLNEQLEASGPINFRLDYIGPVESFPTKDGGTYEARECKLSIPSTGQVETVRLFDNIVGALSVGATLRGEAGPMYPKWTPVASGQVTPENNVQQVKNERAFGKIKSEEVLSRIICTHMAAFESAGEKPSSAKELAVDAYDLQEEAVKEILSRK